MTALTTSEILTLDELKIANRFRQHICWNTPYEVWVKWLRKDEKDSQLLAIIDKIEAAGGGGFFNNTDDIYYAAKKHFGIVLTIPQIQEMHK